jgi:hypothetical protein
LKKEEDIFNQLRQLSEAELLSPPDTAWRKLESKLLVHKKKRKLLKIPIGIIIATLLLLLSISFVAIIITNIHKKEKKAIESMQYLQQLNGKWKNQSTDNESIIWKIVNINKITSDKYSVLNSDTFMTPNVYKLIREKDKITLQLNMNHDTIYYPLVQQNKDYFYFENNNQKVLIKINATQYEVNFENGQKKRYERIFDF